MQSYSPAFARAVTCRHTPSRSCTSTWSGRTARTFLRSQARRPYRAHIDLRGLDADRLFDSFKDVGLLNFTQRKRRELEREQIVLARDDENAAQGREAHFAEFRFHKAHDDIGSRERCVTAELDFATRCKPAQVIEVAHLHSKGRFGQVVLDRDFLHERIGQPPVHDADRSRIPGKDLVGESVHHLLRESCHSSFPLSETSDALGLWLFF